MSKLYVVRAYEQIYGGMHGMEDWFVTEVDDLDEVEMEAREASFDVIDSYGEIYESFESDAELNGLEEGTDEWEAFIEESRLEDIAYDFWEVTTNKYTIDEIGKILSCDPDGFVDEYCQFVEY